MKAEIGKIRIVEKWIHCFDQQSDGKELSTWYEIFDGSKWIGKTYTHKKAMRVSNELKEGKFYV